MFLAALYQNCGLLAATILSDHLKTKDLVNLNRATTNIADRIYLHKIMASSTFSINSSVVWSEFKFSPFSTSPGRFFRALKWFAARKIAITFFHMDSSHYFTQLTEIMLSNPMKHVTIVSLVGGGVPTGIVFALLNRCSSIEKLIFQNNPNKLVLADNFHGVVPPFVLNQLRSLTIVHGINGRITLEQELAVIQLFILHTSTRCVFFQLQYDWTNLPAHREVEQCEHAFDTLKRQNPRFWVRSKMDRVSGNTFLTVQRCSVAETHRCSKPSHLRARSWVERQQCDSRDLDSETESDNDMKRAAGFAGHSASNRSSTAGSLSTLERAVGFAGHSASNRSSTAGSLSTLDRAAGFAGHSASNRSSTAGSLSTLERAAGFAGHSASNRSSTVGSLSTLERAAGFVGHSASNRSSTAGSLSTLPWNYERCQQIRASGNRTCCEGRCAKMSRLNAWGQEARSNCGGWGQENSTTGWGQEHA